nr:hypothetical protein Iba_chr15bCG6070 [Ipomoea batatas]GMD96577.1 hypothetical protein Iba_chr15bCG6080 [Ipomoea batatas]
MGGGEWRFSTSTGAATSGSGGNLSPLQRSLLPRRGQQVDGGLGLRRPGRALPTAIMVVQNSNSKPPSLSKEQTNQTQNNGKVEPLKKP